MIVSWVAGDRSFDRFDSALAAAWLESSATGEAVGVYAEVDGRRKLVASVTNHEGEAK